MVKQDLIIAIEKKFQCREAGIEIFCSKFLRFVRIEIAASFHSS
jgi:hypothetical protein